MSILYFSSPDLLRKPYEDEPRIRMSLLPYQEEALDWCIKHEKTCAILAYDMGLGKTVITCALLQKTHKQNPERPQKTAIMAPACILHQWESEIKKHTRSLNVLIYHGANRKHAQKRIPTADIIITTAHVLANDIKDDADFLPSIDRWVIDEAHQLRNSKCKVYQTLQTYAPNVENKIFLTGTPICNRPTDIISLICLSNFAPYNEEHTWSYMRYINRIELLNKITPEILLRRTKEDTIAHIMPTITTHDIKLSLEEGEQLNVYHSFGDDDIILRRILRLRQAVNNHAPLTEEETVETAIKIIAVNKIIESIPPTDKVIIFSYFTTLLRDLYNTIKIPQEQMQIYHGEMDVHTRNKTIEKFKSDPSARVLLINLRAGGCGLNLTEANHVILMEPYWNESEQQQAINRAHRFGQTKPVNVYRLKVENSIEKWLCSLQKIKHTLSKLLVDRADIPIVEIIEQKELTALLFKES